MSSSFFIASNGLRAYQTKLDTIANNISNVDTAGFKRREASFAENLTVSIQNQAEKDKEAGRLSPEGIRTTFGSRIAATQMDFTQGAPKQTDNPFDMMVEGEGYFQVRRTTNGGAETLYTRSGAFQLTPVEGGGYRLANASGDLLLDENGNPIELANSEFTVAKDGTITGTNQRIGIVTFTNPQLLKNEGGVFRMLGGAAQGAGIDSFQVRQGYLEGSNVQLNEEMTDMIKAQRGFQANSRALSYADQMAGISNGIIRS